MGTPPELDLPGSHWIYGKSTGDMFVLVTFLRGYNMRKCTAMEKYSYGKGGLNI